MFGDETSDENVALGDGGGEDECAGFDAVGNDGVLGAVELFDAGDFDDGCASAFDFGAHFDEEVGDVFDFGLARGVADDGLAFGEDGGHEDVFGAGDGDAIKVNVAADEAVGRLRFDIAVGLDDGGAEMFERGDVHVDGTRADGAAAGHGDAGATGAGDERAEDEAGRAHGFDDFVRGFGTFEGFGFDCDFAGVLRDFCAGVFEQALHGADVFDRRDAVEDDGLVCEKAGGEYGQRCVL